MKQAKNSYLSFKRDFAIDYKKHKNLFSIIAVAFATILVGGMLYLYWGIKSVDNNNKDWEVRKFMWSTRDALDTYYKQNQTYPSDIRSVEIRHSYDTFKVVSSNEIEYLGYKIYYSEIDGKDYKLETYFIGPRDKGKYILYNDKR